MGHNKGRTHTGGIGKGKKNLKLESVNMSTAEE
jgi:hypothetical protein